MKAIRSLNNDQSGAISIVTALLMGMFVLLLGGVIDIGRAYMVKAGVQGGLDAAALAASEFDMSDPANHAKAQKQVRRYFNVNFPRHSWGTNISASKLNITTTPVDSLSMSIGVTLNDTVRMQSFFLTQDSGNSGNGVKKTTFPWRP